ncbi:MAG: hypothetical protein ACR2OR_08880 [Hyphomicrobiales bacterium]
MKNAAFATAILAVILMGIPAPAEARARTFYKPTLIGDPLAACYGSGSKCGKPVADFYCKNKGFSRALSYRLNRTPQGDGRARTVDNQIITVSAKNPEFVFVKCFSPETADRK